MKKKLISTCKGYSDKDFIFDIFSDKGFVTDANAYLHSNHHTESNNIKGENHEALPASESETI